MIENNKPREYGVEFSALAIEQGLDFILSHFEDSVWPRTISTRTTRGSQKLVFNKEEALARFKQANYLDCRISAYPSSKYTRRIKQKPNLLFIDLDSQTLHLDTQLQQTLRNIKMRFENEEIEPTVLWSGKGYHIYLPIDAVVLEQESLFEDIEVYDPSRRFIQWAEQYLTNGKADPCHSKGVSFNNCMLRVPGSTNSKVNKEVKIVQRWNGVRPSIKPLLYEFYIHVADAKLMEIQGIRVKQVSAGKYYSYWRSRK
jgi:hypothetical protein